MLGAFCEGELGNNLYHGAPNPYPFFNVLYCFQVIQISGSASLYYVVRSEHSNRINIKVKQKILGTLLNGMFAHKDDSIMMRNGCLTLCQFQIPQDVVSLLNIRM